MLPSPRPIFHRSLALTLALCLLLPLMAPGAARADDNRQVARAAYQEGTRQFEIGDYQAALAAFKKAYLAYDDPAFLFNMAQCYRLLNDKQEAVRTYRVYLRKVPNAPNRADIEQIINALDQAIAEEKRASSMPPTESQPPATRPEPPPTGSVTPSPPAHATPTPPPPQAASAAAPAAEKEKRAVPPLLKKWWFWAAIGGGVIVVAAVATGVAVGVSSYHPDFKPTLPDVGPAAAAITVRF